MPPAKVRIERIEGHRMRQNTFLKRKLGLIKKAIELTVLCDCDCAILLRPSSPNKTLSTRDGKLVAYCNRDIQTMLQECADDIITTAQVSNAEYEHLSKDQDAIDQVAQAANSTPPKPRKTGLPARPKRDAKTRASLSDVTVFTPSNKVKSTSGGATNANEVKEEGERENAKDGQRLLLTRIRELESELSTAKKNQQKQQQQQQQQQQQSQQQQLQQQQQQQQQQQHQLQLQLQLQLQQQQQQQAENVFTGEATGIMLGGLSCSRPCAPLWNQNAGMLTSLFGGGNDTPIVNSPRTAAYSAKRQRLDDTGKHAGGIFGNFGYGGGMNNNSTSSSTKTMGGDGEKSIGFAAKVATQQHQQQLQQLHMHGLVFGQEMMQAHAHTHDNSSASAAYRGAIEHGSGANSNNNTESGGGGDEYTNFGDVVAFGGWVTHGGSTSGMLVSSKDLMIGEQQQLPFNYGGGICGDAMMRTPRGNMYMELTHEYA